MVAKSPASNCRLTPFSATFSLTVPGLKVLCRLFSSKMCIRDSHQTAQSIPENSAVNADAAAALTKLLANPSMAELIKNLAKNL